MEQLFLRLITPLAPGEVQGKQPDAQPKARFDIAKLILKQIQIAVHMTDFRKLIVNGLAQGY